MDIAEPRCIAFGGLRVVDVMENALLTVVGPGAIAAATTAEKEAGQRRIGARRRQPLSRSGALCSRPRLPNNMMPQTRPTGSSRESWKRDGTCGGSTWRRLRVLVRTPRTWHYTSAKKLPRTSKINALCRVFTRANCEKLA